MRNIAANINIASASCTWRDQRALFDKCQHARQRVVDDPCAILIHFAAETDRVRHVAPHRCAGFFKFPQQKRFLSALRKQCLDCFEVRAGHCKNMRGAIDQRRRERLTAQVADVHAFFRANLHRVETRRLAAHCVDTGRKNFDAFTIAN